jgi:putative solute:sodium symporter small subunit
MSDSEQTSNAAKYWWAKLRLLLVILVIWFIASFGCGIIFRDWLDANLPNVGNAPFGFWMAQQGSIICFVLLLIAYNFLMNRLDSKFGYDEKGEDV